MMPINFLELVSNNLIFKTNYKYGTLLFRVNTDKVNFDRISQLSLFHQRSEFVTIEKVVDYEIYVSSKFKSGFEDLSIRLGEFEELSFKQFKG